ncbi:MAG: Multidrug resistance protein MdtA [Gammaproteobacteria bacterium]|nr:Multidrug resistance protein MdtA [Gammaproteobacteria bacterium]
MLKWMRVGLPILILAGCVAVAAILIKTAPKAERRSPEPSLPVVEIVEVNPRLYTVTLKSQGTVSPRTQSSLIAEVPGRVVNVADELRSGGFFEPGRLLLRIDPRDYENAVTIARSELAQAQLALEEETARTEQARQDWERLGLEGKPGQLALRRPQLDSARAKVAAAEARLEQARIDLQRTRIEAPYAGRVLEKSVDIGQYVTPGTVLSQIYAVDYVEIRLPLSNYQLQHVDLPENYRGTERTPVPIPARITGQIGGRSYSWQGRIVRTEGDIDTDTRQWFIVAQVDDPYARRDGRPPLKVGQFVRAEIEGRRLENVYVLPRAGLRPGDQVVALSPERTIHRRPVDVLWGTHDQVIVRGLDPGDEVVVSAVSFVVDGARVRVAGEEPPNVKIDPTARDHRQGSG